MCFDLGMTSWEELGEHFGYPVCCVEYFCELRHMDEPDKHYRPLAGTGFIACRDCADSKTVRELVREIEAIRACPEPFMSCEEELQYWEAEWERVREQATVRDSSLEIA